MAYTTKAARNAYNRQWKRVNYAARAHRGICRDCPRSCKRGNRQTVLCELCYLKAYQRRPDALDQFNAQKRADRAALRAELRPFQSDRRQGGKISRALAWAVEMRSF